EIGSRRSARPVQRALFQQAYGGDGCSIRNLKHFVDHARNERRLDSRTTDPFDATRRSGRVIGGAGAPAAVERRTLWVDDGDAGGMLPISHVTAEGRTRPTCSGADDDPVRDRMPLARELAESALGDVVIATPVGRPLGVTELSQIVATAFAGESF